MTGKLINKSLVHDSVGMSHDCAPELFGMQEHREAAGEP